MTSAAADRNADPRYQHVAPTAGADDHVPLVVDVDGTLVSTDLLHEALLRLVAERLTQAPLTVSWVLHGKAKLKTELASRVEIREIPLRPEVVLLIEQARTAGRKVYLASASPQRFVDSVAMQLGGVDGIFATDPKRNLAGKEKADALVAAFGKNGFDYVADADIDFDVWKAARKVLVLAGSASFEKRVIKAFPSAEIVARPRLSWQAFVKALRPHQWAKNLLVFLTIIAGQSFDVASLRDATIAFICFCMAASSAYTINDLLDLPGDRQHPTKRTRPYASGAIPIKVGVATAAALIVTALTIAAVLVSGGFALVLSAYYILTLAYSLILKRKILIDLVSLGSLYTLRVLGGAIAVEARHSNWLLMFSLFLFLCLAIVKRYSELRARMGEGAIPPSGRGYRFEDMQLLLPLGAASGYGAVLVIMLYISSPEVAERFRNPDILWLICPFILYWVSRVLVLTNRGEVQEDPVVFALKDKVSWLTATIVAALIILAR